MAESVLGGIFGNTNTRNSANLDCAVCLQTCIHPAELPCGHIFCYLCIKGIVNQGRRCAMCRQDIPADYLDKPRLLKPMDAEITSQGFEDGHLWFYEGHNGWWQYDARTSLELESAHQKGQRCCELLIAGFLYVVDFDGMVQYRRNDPSRRRRIKRDIATTTKKGIAGIKPTKNCSLMLSNTHENVSNEIHQNLSVSNSAALNDFVALPNLNSGSNNSSQHGEQVDGHHRIMERNLSGFSRPSCRTAPVVNSSQMLGENNSNSTNYNLDSTIHSTLDWAIEQIESLNLELLNDYEIILWDYGQSEGNMSQSRHNSITNNYTMFHHVSDPVNECGANDLPTPAVSGINDGRNNNTSLEPPPTTSNRTTPASPDINEVELDFLNLCL